MWRFFPLLDVCRWTTIVSLLTLSTGLSEFDKAQAEETMEPTLIVKATDDFRVTGDGSNVAWDRVPWTQMNRRPNGRLDYNAQFKVLYSNTGLYVLMDGSDELLTAKMDQDFDDLWTEDVYEFFLWTDENYPVYFEYEISPLNKELPILIPNFGGQFLGWRPWHYEGERKTQKAVSISGGPAQSGARIAGWRAEVYVPYKLLEPLQNVPPQAGSVWRANFYRVDHDHEQTTAWDWARVGEGFHEFEKFGTLRFE